MTYKKRLLQLVIEKINSLSIAKKDTVRGI
jgi:hypothetical protein